MGKFELIRTEVENINIRIQSTREEEVEVEGQQQLYSKKRRNLSDCKSRRDTTTRRGRCNNCIDFV